MAQFVKNKCIKSPQHLKAIRAVQFCAACGKTGPVDAAHIRYAYPRYDALPTGMGRKPDDWRTTPLCRTCHTRQHSLNEEAFWKELGIDPYQLAGDLWLASPDVLRMRNITISANFKGNCKT